MPALVPSLQSENISVTNELATDLSEPNLAAAANIRRVKAGETLYVEGDDAPHCYQIVSGVMKEFNTLEDGRRQVADFYGVGELFGISELDQQLHTAEAITDCAIRSYPRDIFMQAIAESPTLSQHFLDMLMTRLHRARERIVMLGRMSAIQRVTTFLLRLVAEQHTAHDVRLMMSRQDMADHLGLTIETVCRTLTDLKKRGLIVMPSARLFAIPDEDVLDEIAHGFGGLH